MTAQPPDPLTPSPAQAFAAAGAWVGWTESRHGQVEWAELNCINRMCLSTVFKKRDDLFLSYKLLMFLLCHIKEPNQSHNALWLIRWHSPGERKIPKKAHCWFRHHLWPFKVCHILVLLSQSDAATGWTPGSNITGNFALLTIKTSETSCGKCFC